MDKHEFRGKRKSLSDQIVTNSIYTTNAIESLNSVIRKAIKNRKIFLHDNSALKVIWLAIHAASKKWTIPLHY